MMLPKAFSHRVVQRLAGVFPHFLTRPSSYALSTPNDAPHRRVISEPIDSRQLAERKPATVTRSGKFYDPRYGEFEISPAMLSDMVRNFEKRTYGQDIFIDVAHKPDEGSAGRITRLRVEGDRLLADVDWTPYGRKAITERGYQYLSAEFIDNYVDNERRQDHGALLFGAGLTIRPVIKRLDPIQLSEPTGLHHALADTLLKEATNTVNKYLEDLIKRLGELGMSKEVVEQLVAAYKTAAKALGEDDAALKTLTEQMIETGKTVAEKLGNKPATVQITLSNPAAATPTEPATKALTLDDVRTLLTEERKQESDKAAALAKTLAERQSQFRSLLDASESVKALTEPQRSVLKEAEQLISAAFTAEQVEALAKQQLKLAEQMAVSAKLAQLGYQAKGSTHIQWLDEATPRKLQESIDRHLRDAPASASLKLIPDDKLKTSVRCILAEFDRINAVKLAEEAKLMADGGTTSTLNIGLPMGYQRTVLREALADLRILDLVTVRTEPNAPAIIMVPYEERKPGAVINDGIVYEGKPIPRASIQQLFDPAYVNQMKLSLKITNEAIYFSQHSIIDWDAYARNVDSNARLIQELVARRLANEMQRASDAYGATIHTAENVATQLTGTASLIKTASWPIVRPKQVCDLRGNPIGAPENPIIVRVNGVDLAMYDGSGEQTAGTYYYVENYNMGLIRLVNQLGVPQTPTASGACTVTYSEAHNLSKFDLKIPAGVTQEEHLNGALRIFGARKAALLADRFIKPEFALMSAILNDSLTNAKQFTPEAARAGSSVDSSGDLITIKAVPSFSTNAPGIDLNDERVLIGQRGALTYTVVKPFVTGAPFEAVDAETGRPTGEKIAYGEEYNSIHVPKPLYPRFTSLILYDSDARTAAT